MLNKRYSAKIFAVIYLNIELIALDIDGTLVDSNKRITDKTKKAIFKFIDMGGKLVIASGRSVTGLKQYVGELGLEKLGGYLISFNGSVTIDLKTGKTVSQTMIEPEFFPEIIECAENNGISIATYKDGKAITQKSRDKYFLEETSLNNLEVVYVENLLEELKYPVPKFLLTDETRDLEQAEQNMKEQIKCVNVFRSEPYYLELVPKDLDKGKALIKLCEYLKIDASKTLACGDGYNDIPLIKSAGIGVAMGNAQPPVKAAADFITLSNDEDGVAYAIEKFCFNV